MAQLCSRAGLVGLVLKGRWLLSWTNCLYGRNLGSLIRTELETLMKWMEASLRPVLSRKRRHPVVLNPIILHDSAKSRTAAAVITDLLRRWQWEILEHPLYSPESMWLRSLRQSEIITTQEKNLSVLLGDPAARWVKRAKGTLHLKICKCFIVINSNETLFFLLYIKWRNGIIYLHSGCTYILFLWCLP